MFCTVERAPSVTRSADRARDRRDLVLEPDRHRPARFVAVERVAAAVRDDDLLARRRERAEHGDEVLVALTALENWTPTTGEPNVSMCATRFVVRTTFPVGVRCCAR
jgi:hypothetical protein